MPNEADKRLMEMHIRLFLFVGAAGFDEQNIMRFFKCDDICALFFHLRLYCCQIICARREYVGQKDKRSTTSSPLSLSLCGSLFLLCLVLPFFNINFSATKEEKRRTHAHTHAHTPSDSLLFLTHSNHSPITMHAQQEHGYGTCAGVPTASSSNLKPTTSPHINKMSPLFSASKGVLPPHCRNSAQSHTRKDDPRYQAQKER